MSSTVRMFGRSVRRGVVVAVLLAMLVTTVAAAAIILRNSNPFTGGVVPKTLPTINMVMVNDDGVASGTPACPGWDCTEVASAGLDPNSLKGNGPDYLETREIGNLANCTATADGDHVHVTWTDTYEGAYCAIWLRFVNPNNKSVSFKAATVTGAPVTVAQAPACGSVTIAPAAMTAVVLQLTPSAGASGSWTTATLDVDWIFAGMGVCP